MKTRLSGEGKSGNGRVAGRAGNAFVLAGCLFSALLLVVLPASAPAQVIINELMYHPDDGWQTNASGAWVLVTNETEYIEIYNSGTNAVDLSTYRFDNGISCEFPPNTSLGAGAFLIVCKNRTAFTNAYTNVSWTATNCVGDYKGNLNNGGERVTLSQLVSNEWITVDTIKYIDGGLADGEGYSLELVHPGFAGQRDQFYGAWAASTNTGIVTNGIRYGGTPGRTNSVYNTNAPPVVGDVLHDPPLPPAGSSILITCRAAARSGLPDQVNLLWRWDQNPQTILAELRMYDDGLHGDAVAGDGVYSRMFPTNGAAVPTNGQLLEFKISAAGGGSVTNPAISTADVISGPYSYLCCFGEDTGFTGEYATYHILMTAANRNILLQDASRWSKTNLDATLITSDGRIFYNSGARYRGDSSVADGWGTKPHTCNYRVELPRGESVGGHAVLQWNWQRPLSQFLGMTVANRTGYGVAACDTKLSRLWLSETFLQPNSQGNVFVQIESIDEIVKSHFDDDTGNYYTANGWQSEGPSYRGSLNYETGLDTYFAQYLTDTNNPVTIWHELSNLCWIVDMADVSLFPTILSNRLNVRYWARYFATQVALDKGEVGFDDPGVVGGDELRLYANPADGQFYIFPWDYSDFLSNRQLIWGWDGAESRMRKVLFNPPASPFYVGDVLDAITNTMSDANMNLIYDSMGSALTSVQRTSFSNSIASQRAGLLGKVATVLTVNVANAVNQGPLGVVVTNASVQLYGSFPQPYTASIRVNGAQAAWDSWLIADMQNTYGKWSTTNMTILLTNAVNALCIETIDSYGNVLISTNLTVIVRTNSTTKGGAISGAVTWNKSNGVVYVTNDVTIPTGSDSLTILPGTTVLFDANKKISVESGALYVVGATNDPVYMFPSNGASVWSIEASGGTVGITNAQMTGGRIAVSGTAALTLSDSTVRGNLDSGGIIAASGSGLVRIFRCIISDFAKTAFSGTIAQVDQCLFRNMSDCGLEFSSATGTVSRTSVTNSSGEGIRFLTGGSGMVTNCLLGRISGSGVRVASGAGNASVCRSLLYSCGTGLVVQSAAPVTNFNNTIALCGVGLSGAPSATWNTIVWSNTVATNGGPAISWSDVELPLYAVCAGTSNMNRNPWFTDLAEIDCRLQSISPCLTTGSNSTYMGAAFPAGCTPLWPSNLTLATPDTNLVVLTWSDNSGDEDRFEIQRSADGILWQVLTNVSANTMIYTNQGLLPETAYWYRVRAAHWRGESLWSEERQATTIALTSTDFLRQYLRITEIMYHPTNDPAEEFIEFKNISTNTPLNLSGLYTDDSRIVFTNGTMLGPTNFFVLVRSNTAFAARYPGVPINGVFSSKNLDNGGETLWVKDSSGSEILNFTYKDGKDWYPSTDGPGYSLVPVDPNPGTNGMSDQAYWRPSSTNGGSPGRDDPETSYGIVINEILTHSHGETPDVGDWIELYNPTTNSVNIRYWFISDSSTNLTKFRITNNVVIPPGGYTNFTQTNNFGENVLGPSKGFAFSEAGGSAYVSSGDANTNLANYRVVQSFGAAERGVSFGRYTTSDRKIHFTSMSNLTRNASNSNSYPKVGPVVISEIMYNPYAGGKEFIELHNITSSNIPLYDAEFGQPTNTWKVTGGMHYTFPTNTTIASNEYILVVGTDTNEFRQATGLTNAAVRIFGPADGQLNNAGDTVNLDKPVAQDEYPEVPYVRIDRVEFSDNVPWPILADNGGASLERRSLTAYGNDPTNWVAASYGGTPGAANNTNGMPSVAFTIPHGEGYESNVTVNVAVSLFPANTGVVTVAYAVVGGTTASQGMDYALSPSNLVFWPYDTTKYIPLRISNDAVQEADETVLIALTNVSANARLGGNSLFTWTIIDTNPAAIAAPTIAPAGTNNFWNSTNVTITSTVPNSTIYYTTDGSIPDSSDNIYTGAITLTASARITARTYLGSYQAGSWTSALFIAQTPPWETDPSARMVRVSQSSDDAYEQIPGPGSNSKVWSSGKTFLPLGRTNVTSIPNDAPWTGVRFTGLNISNSVTVTNAYIQFYVYAEVNTNITVVVRGHKTNDAPTFVEGTTTNISLRPRTSSYVTWSDNHAWGPTGYAGEYQRTPCLTNIVNEIISMQGWTTNSAMAFIFSNVVGGQKKAYAWDGNPNCAPELHFWTAPKRYWLDVKTNGSGFGTITGGNVFVAHGTSVWVNASASQHYRFGGWTGNVDGVSTASNDIWVTMTSNRNLWGNFSDILYTNNVTEAWLANYYPYTNNFTNASTSDTDEDGHKAWQEFIAGTDPTNALSVLKITAVSNSPGGSVIFWPVVTGRTYSVFGGTNLLEPWPATPATSYPVVTADGTICFTNSASNTPWFYRIGVSK